MAVKRGQSESGPSLSGSEAETIGFRPLYRQVKEALIGRIASGAWRAGEAKTQGVPAYIVFGDATLRALADQRPGSVAALEGITGIGAKKREAYGEAVLAVIARA